MFNREEILKIVAEKHSLIVSENDPILSVLALSDVMYEEQNSKLLGLIETLTKSNSKRMSQQIAALQTQTLGIFEKRHATNQRVISAILSEAMKELDTKNIARFDAIEKNLSIDRNYKKISFFLGIYTILLLGFIALIIVTKGF
jgi:hypothetical protein